MVRLKLKLVQKHLSTTFDQMVQICKMMYLVLISELWLIHDISFEEVESVFNNSEDKISSENSWLKQDYN